MDFANYYGSDSEILDWWLNSGLELKYTEKAMNLASQKGYINKLNWWLKSGLELKYTKEAFNFDCNERDKQIVIDWWNSSGLRNKKLIYF
ncbi:hypothetical protein H012_gp321 [Acanthamoeba polyphaga moumouvirus]|uniref:Ankyrin repeat protein n=2 Tax=Moumouvirus TaxID=3080801 RepID=L7RC66_9VIRU|nr:hypothetical protein H012_gp321 [Acanthamoeba polyphaga moumouvirus]AGC02134.1 hypothetical protein Moumou_00608 [Acanthamoeba polyphaga moumouvirus]